MANENVPGRSLKRGSDGILRIPTYIRIPYSLLKAEDFDSLSPSAVKVYMVLIAQWKTHKPDIPVEMSIDQIRQHCPSVYEKKGKGKALIRRNKIQKALTELDQKGFIHKRVRHRRCNQYYIDQRWYTGEYK